MYFVTAKMILYPPTANFYPRILAVPTTRSDRGWEARSPVATLLVLCNRLEVFLLTVDRNNYPILPWSIM